MENEAPFPHSQADRPADEPRPDPNDERKAASEPDASRSHERSHEELIAGLRAALNEARELAEEYRQRYLYAWAEAENLRKRMERSIAAGERSFKKKLIRDFLTILDNLELAVQHAESEGLREGLRSIVHGFETILKAHGVTPVYALGEPFDPNVAEAIATEASSLPNNLVIAQTRRGFRVDGELLRPALVIVAKHQEE
jgi:molecular chaperone GrpE